MNLLSKSRTLTPVGILAIVFATQSGLDAKSASADWPQWRGPQRSGFVTSGPLVESLPGDGLQAIWQVSSFAGGNSGGWSSPVIAGDRVYAYAHTKTKNPAAVDMGPEKFPWLPPQDRTGMTDEEYREYEVKRRDENEARAKAFLFEERLLCVSLVDGKVLWDQRQESKYTRFTHSGTPCVADGKVFLLGAERMARCYDAASGELLWSKKLPGDFRDEYFCSSFSVLGDIAVVCCGPVTALSVQDGTVRWQGDEPLEYQSHSSPVIWQSPEAAVVIANAGGGVTKGYRMDDGEKLWEVETGAGQSTPIVTGDLLLTYGSSRKSGLSAFRLAGDAPQKEPELLWQFRGAADSGSSPVVRGDYAFVQGDKRLAKVSLADGKAVWQTTLRISNPRYTSLIAAGDQVFYGWEGILAVDAESPKYRELYDAEIDFEGTLIGEAALRAKLKGEAGGGDSLADAEKIWQAKAIKTGPLGCSTPAISDGRLVVRLRDGMVCYDLRRQGT